MQTRTRKTGLYAVALAVILLAIAGLLVYRFVIRPPEQPAAAASEAPPVVSPQIVVREREVEKLVEVEKTITADIIRDGLRDMGVLVTQEYDFTEVISASNVKTLDLDLKLFHINETLPFTESSFIASYDGTVTAGLDCGGIRVEKDEDSGRITVTLPPAEILTVDVDPDSFRLYDEKQGVGTRITVEDYNRALSELEASAAQRAVERGVLDRAGDNARVLIRRFVQSLMGSQSYTLVFAEGDK